MPRVHRRTFKQIIKGNKTKIEVKLNKTNLERKEFQELWKRINRKTEAYLLSADSVKTTLIREFLADGTHTLSLPMNDGLVIELNSLGIISMAGKTQMTGPRFDGQLEVRYFLQPRIISIIDNNPELKKKYKRK